MHLSSTDILAVSQATDTKVNAVTRLQRYSILHFDWTAHNRDLDLSIKAYERKTILGSER